jgi:hypothetical protein
MSLKHLFAGILFGVFTVTLGYDPAGVAPVALAPGVVGADKTASADASSASDRAAEDKRAAQAAREAARDKSRDKPTKTAAREMTWAQRLVFPAGNKF